MHEAEQRLLARPDDAISHYLYGRVVRDGRQKLASFQRAAQAYLPSFILICINQ